MKSKKKSRTKNTPLQYTEVNTKRFRKFTVNTYLLIPSAEVTLELAYWDANMALGQDKQRKLPYKTMHAFRWSCPNATFAS